MWVGVVGRRQGVSGVFGGEYGRLSRTQRRAQLTSPQNSLAERSTTVTAPAGKLGLLFDEFTTPPTVTSLAALSSLHGKVKVGWKLEKVDDVDVSKMTGAAATQLLEERAANARRLEFDVPPKRGTPKEGEWQG